MTEKLHICQKCRSQMFQKFNSSIWVCFECEKKAKSVKSKPTITKKVTVQKNGLKNVAKRKSKKQGIEQISGFLDTSGLNILSMLIICWLLIVIRAEEYTQLSILIVDTTLTENISLLG